MLTGRWPEIDSQDDADVTTYYIKSNKHNIISDQNWTAHELKNWLQPYFNIFIKITNLIEILVEYVLIYFGYFWAELRK